MALNRRPVTSTFTQVIGMLKICCGPFIRTGVRKIAGVIVATLCHTLLVNAGERVPPDAIVSQVCGLGLAERLIADEALRQEIELSEDQFQDLQNVVAGGNFRRPDRGMHIVRSLDLDLEDFAPNLTAPEAEFNQELRTALIEVLAPAQSSHLRRAYLRDHFRSPLETLNDFYLAQLDLSRAEIKQVLGRINPTRLKEIAGRCDALRSTALYEIQANWPAKSQLQFAACFGRKYAVDAASRQAFDPKCLSVFKRDPQTVVWVASHTLPSGSRQKIETGGYKISNSDARNAPNLDELLRRLIVEGSSSSHYERTIWICHQQQLELDLNILVNSRAASYLQLPAEALPTTEQLAAKWQRKLDALRRELEVPIFKAIISESEPKVRNKLSRFYDGVWCDLVPTH